LLGVIWLAYLPEAAIYACIGWSKLFEGEEYIMTIDSNWLEEKIFLRKLSTDEAALLENLMQTDTYTAGDKIMQQGEPCDILHILHSGVADIECDSNGATSRIAAAREGSLFGEMSFLTGEAASASVTAHKDCVVYSLSRKAYADLMQRNQDLVFALFTHILVHTATVIRHMNEEHLALQQYIMGRRV